MIMNDSSSGHFPRILHIITRLDAGGSATNTIVSVAGLRKEGFETALAYGTTRDPDGAIRRRLESLGLPLFFVPGLVRNPSPLNDFKAWLDLKRLLRDNRFDLVHTHTSKAGVIGRLAARAYGVPAVHTAHGHVFYGYFGRLLTRVFVGIERRMAPLAERLISLTDEETQEALERNIGRPGQYVTIPSGVPIAQFRDIDRSDPTFRKRLGIPPEATVFLSVGRLTWVKGYDMLLEAFSKAGFGSERPWLVLVGDGEERGKLEEQAKRLKIIDRVCFTGELADIREALAASTVFVLSSRNEGMGRVLVEAMAAGLPVIGTAVGGIPTLVKDGETGLLVPGGDAGALAKAMERLRAGPELRARLAERASRFIYPAYDESCMIASIAAVYRDVLAKKT